MADELGKHRWHVKDTWRRIKMRNLNKGPWLQKEYQQLFDLNICWTAISDKLSTRPQSTCCNKWYKQLTSPMVDQGLWADSDDYRMLGVLYILDANCIEDVDWDNLLDGRSGDVCRKRWNQMVLYIGNHRSKSFAEQVDVLAQRYCPNLVEAREAWDSKPRVP
ncbi:hypothetical protein ACJIZ3_020870 [Penstemon smallii]|uniref:Myb-like domain-containing protein n=1 Tax=Penstemon smallii TaxID=265156 RepID=A0ABD3SJU6_9LAMI